MGKSFDEHRGHSSRLRFEENLPIRTIALRWGVPAAELHHAYALARQEFKAILLEVVAFHHPGSPAEVEQEVTLYWEYSCHEQDA